MGDLTEMLPFEGLDGTKRMVRWDMYAGVLVERALRDAGWDASERNLVKGIVLDIMDVTAITTFMWAMLAAADEWMGLKDAPRLTLKRVRQLMTDHNVQACLESIAECRAMNEPPPVKKVPKKRGGSRAKKRKAKP